LILPFLGFGVIEKILKIAPLLLEHCGIVPGIVKYDFDLVWPTTADFILAYQLLSSHHLAVASSIPDCLIAAMSLQRSATLCTFNAKHYRHIPALELEVPYTR
jgi:hypothetical protein